MDAAAIVVAVLALAVSIYVGIRQVQLQDRMVKIEESRDKVATMEAKRAKVVVSRDQTLGRRGIKPVLRVSNLGPGEARSVRIVLDDLPMSQHGAVMTDQDEIPVLGPGGELEFTLIIHSSQPAPASARVTWEDDSKEPGEFNTTL